MLKKIFLSFIIIFGKQTFAFESLSFLGISFEMSSEEIFKTEKFKKCKKDQDLTGTGCSSKFINVYNCSIEGILDDGLLSFDNNNKLVRMDFLATKYKDQKDVYIALKGKFGAPVESTSLNEIGNEIIRKKFEIVDCKNLDCNYLTFKTKNENEIVGAWSTREKNSLNDIRVFGLQIINILNFKQAFTSIKKCNDLEAEKKSRKHGF